MLSKNSLKFRLPLFAVSLTLMAVCTLAVVTERIASQRMKMEAGEVMSRRAMSFAGMIDRLMAERVSDISVRSVDLVRSGLLDRPAQMRAALEGVKNNYDGYAWIGYADRTGHVVAATDALLEGADVSSRPWFQNASHSPFVGDVHRALLLEKKLKTEDNEPLRFLDIAVPVLGREDEVVGVLCAHIDWRWIKGLAQLLPLAAQRDVLLVASDNTVLLGPLDMQGHNLPEDVVSNLRQSKSGYGVARWPDGKIYLSGHALSRGYRSYSGLQWLIVIRQDVHSAYLSAAEIRNQIILWGAGIAAMFALLGWLVAKRISQPLAAISNAAAAIEAGNTAIRIPQLSTFHEVTVLARALSSLIQRLLQREAELEHLATHNALTHLPNRTLIKALIDQAVARAHAAHEIVSVITVSFDGYEHLNTLLGNALGDEILRKMATRLKGMTNDSTLGHLGRDEFVLLLTGRGNTLAGMAEATLALQSIMGEPVIVDDSTYFLRPVIGISHYPKDGRTGEILLGCSEAAMHQARRPGSNRLHVFHAQMNAEVLERLDLERDLSAALHEGQFEVHYQPQVASSSSEIVGLEALIRWRHPERGLISPAKFIPVAEASGLILPLGEWILNEACRQTKHWHDLGHMTLRVAVNVSSRQFSEANLLGQVAIALDSSSLDPACLKLEITESMLMGDVDKSIGVMRALKGLGVTLAMDDFGTGYSSLSYLSQFPIDQLKVDQSFVRALLPGTDNSAIVHTIVALGHNLGMDVIAEGVETLEQVAFLKKAGCDEMQGYHFSKPLPADAVTQLLQAARLPSVSEA